ncbi:dihydroneopterin aldolase [Taibaiella chishuiensis]|uniref:Dihydroneopterin aldolase n=1 Tax=Taibaiella chishuiensis TaxID=1434707 RepID=A0A2P8CV86_9BACT|nr:dihydroneopterin aldolase [Taibaiella chishuiensis]PSK88849.1 dihydroneopterin aldolase [Taibaiella chishuiensis]
MLTVSLAGVRFHAAIGLYPQEAFLLNEIEMQISVSVESGIDTLPLIDYTRLHSIAAASVSEPAALLETVVQRIVTAINLEYPGSKLSVAVRKLNPPMPGTVAHSEVKWES